MGGIEEYKYLQGWVKHLSTIDAPTGVLNRHGWLTIVERHLKRAAQAQQRVAVLLFEIDQLAHVTDQFGHEVGDQAPQHVADLLESRLRPGDLLGRWVEETFILFLPSQDIEFLRAMCERLRKEVERTPLVAGELRVSLTVSIGGAGKLIKTGDLRELDGLLSESDQRLSLAKQLGRNRVVV